MSLSYLTIAAELGAAWAAGGVVGLERSYHGRAAGFRTHCMVAIASAAAMLVTTAPQMAQGVVTGVGFLGAGVIFKEGVNVQGLTTAATVWATAILGLLFGAGEFAAGAATTGGMLVTLVLLRWVEARMPSRVYALAVLRFRAKTAPDEATVRKKLAGFGVNLRDLSYALTHDGTLVEFSGNVMASSEGCFQDLAGHLRGVAGLAEFELSRISK